MQLLRLSLSGHGWRVHQRQQQAVHPEPQELQVQLPRQRLRRVFLVPPLLQLLMRKHPQLASQLQ